MKTKAYTLIELLICLAIAGILVALLGAGLSGCSRSEGSRAGIVTKFSHKGNLTKSWEGEMVMGGMRVGTDSEGSSMLQANVWQFTVTDPNIVEQVKEALRQGYRVELEYKQTMMHNPLKRDTSYTIIKVTPIVAK